MEATQTATQTLATSTNRTLYPLCMSLSSVWVDYKNYSVVFLILCIQAHSDNWLGSHNLAVLQPRLIHNRVVLSKGMISLWVNILLQHSLFIILNVWNSNLTFVLWEKIWSEMCRHSGMNELEHSLKVDKIIIISIVGINLGRFGLNIMLPDCEGLVLLGQW